MDLDDCTNSRVQKVRFWLRRVIYLNNPALVGIIKGGRGKEREERERERGRVYTSTGNIRPRTTTTGALPK